VSRVTTLSGTLGKRSLEPFRRCTVANELAAVVDVEPVVAECAHREVLLTAGLEARLGEREERSEPRQVALRDAEAADRIAVHLARVIERAVAKRYFAVLFFEVAATSANLAFTSLRTSVAGRGLPIGKRIAPLLVS
jgi:hypothetical protein